MPFAGDTPSEQQPNLVSLHVSLTLHPSSNGPVAAVLLSGQQPNSLLRHAAGVVRRLHLSGLCSLLMIDRSIFGVVLHKSSSVVEEMSVDEDDQMSVVDDSVEISDVDSVLSVELLSLVLLDSLDDSLVLEDSLEDSLVLDGLDDSLDDSLVLDDSLDDSLVLDGLDDSLEDSLVLDDASVLDCSVLDEDDASELLELDASVLLPSVEEELELESVDDNVVVSGCSVVDVSASVVDSVVPAVVDSVL